METATRETGDDAPAERPEGTASVGIVSLGSCAITHPALGIPVGGAELQLFLIGKALARHGFSVVLYVADCGQQEECVAGVEVRHLMRIRRWPHIPTGAVPGACMRLVRRRHAVYITQSPSFITGVVRVASWLAGGRLLHMCAHDDEARGMADATLSSPARWLHHLGMRRADLITCQNAVQSEAIAAHFRRQARLVPNPLPDGEAALPAEQRAGLLWVGRDVDWKCPEALLTLARRLPRVPFTMVCQPQPDRDADRLRRAAPSNVRFLPGLPYREAARLFGAHRALVCTSRTEGFPNTFYQAASVGTPILSLNVDPDGTIARHDAGYVCANDLAVLERRCAELAEDGGPWRKCHDGALRMARSAGGWEEVFCGIVRELAAGARRQGGRR